ncbi:hypothetical protein ACHAO1_011261 [Botrytis cinerea]
MVTIQIDVVIDTTCRFCYIALNHITKAIDIFGKRYIDDSVVVQWLPQILYPYAPKTPIELTVFSARIVGPGVLEEKFKRDKVLGRAEGIKFNQGRKIGNTYDSHRLIHLAGKKSAATQSAVVRMLFEGHLEGGESPSSHDFLIDVAVKSEIERSEAAAWMESNVGGAEVEDKIRAASAKGIRGVPHVTIQEIYPVGSNYDSLSLLTIFERIRGEGFA